MEDCISGHAAVFWKPGDKATEFDMGDMTERIKPGAFSKALGSGDISSYTNHDPNFLLGRQGSDPLSLALREDATGLHSRIFPFDTSPGRDALTMVRNRGLRGMSFGFSMQGGHDTWTEERGRTIRTLEEVGKLYDCSPVVHPAYVGTTCRIEAAQRSVVTIHDSYGRRAREISGHEFDPSNMKGQAMLTIERSDDRSRGESRSVAHLQTQTRLRQIARRAALLGEVGEIIDIHDDDQSRREAEITAELKQLDIEQRSLSEIIDRRGRK